MIGYCCFSCYYINLIGLGNISIDIKSCLDKGSEDSEASAALELSTAYILLDWAYPALILPKK